MRAELASGALWDHLLRFPVDRAMSTASKEAGESIRGLQGATGGLEKLPDHPGEDAFSHEGTLWIEQAERILARLRLLGVANGDEPDEGRAIKLFPLELIPPLPAGHSYAEKRKMERLEKTMANQEKAEKKLYYTSIATGHLLILWSPVLWRRMLPSRRGSCTRRAT